jgi:uncharacterized damage-inducible protein DinB
MGGMARPLLDEFREEAATTRRVLERVPSAKLSWKPHVKSMALGQLAWHVAVVPGNVAKIAQQGKFDVFKANFVPPLPQSAEEILTAYEESLRQGEECLQNMSDEEAQQSWMLMRGDRQISARPRIEFIRRVMLNHWYHHRGQLSVYLRLLDIPIPVIYGPSADESPFQ